MFLMFIHASKSTHPGAFFTKFTMLLHIRFTIILQIHVEDQSFTPKPCVVMVSCFAGLVSSSANSRASFPGKNHWIKYLRNLCSFIVIEKLHCGLFYAIRRRCFVDKNETGPFHLISTPPCRRRLPRGS